MFSELMNQALAAVDSGSYTAIVALYTISALEEIGVPFPFVMDAALYYHGFSIDRLLGPTILLVAALLFGRLLGSSGVYWVSRIGLGRLFRWLALRHPKTWGRILRFRDRINRRVPVTVAAARLSAEAPAVIGFTRLLSNGPASVAIARLTPGLLTATSVASGMLGVKYTNFVLGIMAASFFSDISVITIGAIMGYSYRHFGFTFPPLYAIGGMVVIGGLAMLTWSIIARKRKRQ
jgi:membrane protein DedA with SNARE-associated domain